MKANSVTKAMPTIRPTWLYCRTSIRPLWAN